MSAVGVCYNEGVFYVVVFEPKSFLTASGCPIFVLTISSKRTREMVVKRERDKENEEKNKIQRERTNKRLTWLSPLIKVFCKNQSFLGRFLIPRLSESFDLFRVAYVFAWASLFFAAIKRFHRIERIIAPLRSIRQIWCHLVFDEVLCFSFDALFRKNFSAVWCVTVCINSWYLVI